MSLIKPPVYDDRDAPELRSALLALQPGYAPEWRPSADGPDAALVSITARYLEIILQRLNHAPEKNMLAFLSLLGFRPVPPRPARAPVVFQLSKNGTNSRLPAGARLAAPPPPEGSDQVMFEIERATGLATARLAAVYSLWPGRDEYIDHSAAQLAGTPYKLFDRTALQPIPHSLYIAHDPLLALAGESTVKVLVDLVTPSSEALDLIWEYWDGEIWREFRSERRECDKDEAARLDGTDGLRQSGAYLLATDCAETKKTRVNGVEGFWVRARLDEPLPPLHSQILPVVDSIQLSTRIRQPLSVTIAPENPRDVTSEDISTFKDCEAPGVPLYYAGIWARLRVMDEDQQPLPEISLTLTGETTQKTCATDLNGAALFRLENATAVHTAAISFLGKTDRITFPASGEPLRSADFTVTIAGIKPDKAFNNSLPLEVDKPFYPFGMTPQPGATFYFTNAEVFGKPGARCQIYVQPARTPQDALTVNIPGRTTNLTHTVIWEYWDGLDWRPLSSAYTNPPGGRLSPQDFTGAGCIELTVPENWEPLEVNGQTERWVRVRLLGGSYGFRNEISITNAANVEQTRMAVVIPQPPSIGRMLLGYEWESGPYQPQAVLAYNDFQYTDRTFENTWEGRTYEPFQPSADLTPAVYLGFDQDLPVDRLGLFANLVEDRDDTLGPALTWEYFNGIAWRELQVDDETRRLRVPGLVGLIGPEDSKAFPRFDQPLHWLRARLKEDGPPGEPEVLGLFFNAAWATQQETVSEEPLGASDGRPNSLFRFRRIPVMDGERIEVRELAGLQANVEWRLLARELFAGDEQRLRQVEARLVAEGPAVEVVEGDLRLVRDRSKRVVEAWVLWRRAANFFSAGPGERVYLLDGSTGRLYFGDGRQGKVPPAGARIQARRYVTGGGAQGNVEAGKISQLLLPAGAVESVFNPLAAQGGAEGETWEAFRRRAPASLRHRGRAISLADYETMAREASASVAKARAIAGRDLSGHALTGQVILEIIPHSREPRPWPSFGLRDLVRRYLAERLPAGVLELGRVEVTGPQYQPVDVSVTITPLDPAEAGAVEQAVRTALLAFLHPLTGGPSGAGWEAGRDVYLSDVAAVIERVPGVDYAGELALETGGQLFGEFAAIPPDRLVVAGELRIKMIQEVRSR